MLPNLLTRALVCFKIWGQIKMVGMQQRHQRFPFCKMATLKWTKLTTRFVPPLCSSICRKQYYIRNTPANRKFCQEKQLLSFKCLVAISITVLSWLHSRRSFQVDLVYFQLLFSSANKLLQCTNVNWFPISVNILHGYLLATYSSRISSHG